MLIRADFTHITGKIRPLHGVGQAPLRGNDNGMFHYLGEAGIPYSRTHDVGGAYGGARFADIHNIFRDFDADENDPASYDFTFTDWLLTSLTAQGVEPFFRFGETIENNYRMKAYRIYPPADPGKWARICEHIVRHYNEGWADGYHMGIRYWEIWNEPEGEKTLHGGACFLGTQEEYFRLYEVTANHLKNCFGDTIKVGGYAACGFYAWEQDKDLTGIRTLPYETHAQHWIDFFHDFLAYISSDEHKGPLDFFSWHSYGQPDETAERAAYCRRVLEKYGFGEVEDILDEWNCAIGFEKRRTPLAAAKNLAMMLTMQKTRTSLMTFYDARVVPSDYAGMFDGEGLRPLPTYFAFLAFDHLYRLENEIETDCGGEGVYVGGAVGDGRKLLLVSNPSGSPAELTLDVTGADADRAEVILLDSIYTFSPTGLNVRDGKLTLPAGSFAELRF